MGRTCRMVGFGFSDGLWRLARASSHMAKTFFYGAGRAHKSVYRNTHIEDHSRRERCKNKPATLYCKFRSFL